MSMPSSLYDMPQLSCPTSFLGNRPEMRSVLGFSFIEPDSKQDIIFTRTQHSALLRLVSQNPICFVIKGSLHWYEEKIICFTNIISILFLATYAFFNKICDMMERIVEKLNLKFSAIFAFIILRNFSVLKLYLLLKKLRILCSTYSSSMTPGDQISRAHIKRAKRKRIRSVSAAMKLTSYVVKKFREIVIEDDIDSLPFKKRKISEHKLKQRLNVGDIPLFATDNLSNSTLNKNECVQDEPVIKSPPLNVTILPKNDCSKQFINIKQKSPEKSVRQLSHIKKKSPEKSYKTRSSKPQLLSPMLNTAAVIKKNPVATDLLVFTTIRNLTIRFENCVNVIRSRRLQNIVDIDSIVRSFSRFGKVVGIQDHWTRPKGSWNQYPSLWLGATVTYRCVEDLQHAVKAVFLENTPVICVPLLEHLIRISSVEMEYIHRHNCSNYHGTSILIENICHRVSRSKLQVEFECHGPVLNVKWVKSGDAKRSCEVTYISTTIAIAAALALDGKTVQRSVLRAKIKMTSREIFIHRKLCEMS